MEIENAIRGQRDWSRIDVNDPADVEYVHHQFPWISHQQIREVIREHGPDRGRVESVLERTGKKTGKD